MVTVLNDLNSHSFVGIKKTWARRAATGSVQTGDGSVVHFGEVLCRTTI